MLENVKGLVQTKKHKEFYERMKRKLYRSSYSLFDSLENALQYGVPQYRDRLVLVGLLRSKFGKHLNFQIGQHRKYAMEEIQKMKDMYKKTLDEYCEKINHALLRLTENKPELQKIVCEAMEYSLSAGGKRIRPVLMLEFCKMCGGNSEKYIDLSCTVEMVHTYSLIHDDLPCMDNDDFRRGKPSCHKMFPEAIALLAGDALNTLPYEIISSKAIEGTISYESSVKLSNILSSSTGVMGMMFIMLIIYVLFMEVKKTGFTETG